MYMNNMIGVEKCNKVCVPQPDMELGDVGFQRNLAKPPIIPTTCQKCIDASFVMANKFSFKFKLKQEEDSLREEG